MRIRWHEPKRQQVLAERQIDFALLDELFDFALLDELFELPYIEDQRNDDPEQYRVIGFAGGRLVSFIIEYRQDRLGDFIWVVTSWHATSQ